jgi:hypothetical protein
MDGMMAHPCSGVQVVDARSQVFIVGMPENIHFRNQNLEEHRHRRLEVGNCCEYCRRSLREPSSLGSRVLFGHGRRMDR